CPLTPLTTLAKVVVTPVTHVAAEAEDNSPALRLPTVSAARSVWFEADANSASRTAARRGTIVCFGLVIRPPSGVLTCPEHCRTCLAKLCKTRGLNRAIGRICFDCCKGATIRFTRAHAGKDKCHYGWGPWGSPPLRCSGKVRSAPLSRPISHRPG